MDSKPIAIIIAIVVTVGAMGAVAVSAGNIFAGTSTSTDLLPKTTQMFSIDSDHMEANIQFTNQGTGTLTGIVGSIEIDGLYNQTLTSRTATVEPYQTLVLTGSVKSDETTNIGTRTPSGDQWDVYPGESVLLRISVKTTSGDTIEKLHEITVR